MALVVRDSLILGAGKGLFTTVPIKKHTILGVYYGEPLTAEQYASRYGTDLAVYVLQTGPNCYIDAITSSCIFKFMNDARDMRKNNCAFKKNGNVITSKRIKAESELLVGYGREFWSSHATHLHKSATAHKKAAKRLFI